jgi:hypothetical protein
MNEIIPIETIERRIYLIQGQKVIIDRDLAELYGVTTKRLNEQVKRNADRFPEDFAFRLSAEEWMNLKTHKKEINRSQFATGSQKHRDPRFLPWAFTEHGAIMAANVLNSKQAVSMSVYVVRAFVHLRQMLDSNRELAKKIYELEKKYDHQFKAVFTAIKELLVPPEKKKRKIGFKREKEE